MRNIGDLVVLNSVLLSAQIILDLGIDTCIKLIANQGVETRNVSDHGFLVNVHGNHCAFRQDLSLGVILAELGQGF